MSARLDAIHKASRSHPLVHFALDQLVDDEDTFAPRDSLGPTLVQKLGELHEPDALLAAVLGLFDLATVLQEKQNAFEAGEVILGSLEKVSAQIETAVEGLPEASGLAGALKARKRDGYGAAAGPKAVTLEAEPRAHVGNAGFDLTAPPKKKR